MAKMTQHAPSAAQLRETLVANFAARLQHVIPDGWDGSTPLSFDDLEAAAVRTGDETACAIMSRSLEDVQDILPKCTKQGRCKCGRNLQWSDKPRTLMTVRGEVTVTRLHGYCRVCERGFFPRGPLPPAAAVASKRSPAPRAG
jgi:hypothetical protein